MPQQRPITLESLIRGERFVEELAPREAAAMLTALAAVQLALANRILTAEPQPPLPQKSDDSVMLSVDDVATLLRASRRAIYGLSRRVDWRSFTVRVSRRCLRFREAGLKKWLTQPASQSRPGGG